MVDDDVIVAVGRPPSSGRGIRTPRCSTRGAASSRRALIDAHQHLTGDPLVRSCIPDLLPPGDSIFEWSVPVHGAHRPLDDELAASLSAVEALTNGVTTVVEAGRWRRSRPRRSRPDRREAYAPRSGCGDGTSRTVRSPPGRRGARPAAGGHCRPWPAGGRVDGWVTLVGHDLASDELLAGARGSRPRVRHRNDDAPVAHVVRPRALPRADGPPAGGASRRPRRTGSPPAHRPRRVARRRRGRADPVERHGDRLLPVGVPAARAGCLPTAATPRSSSTAGGSRWDATRPNAGDLVDILRTAAVAAGIAHDTRIDPTRFGAAPGVRARHHPGAEAIGLGHRIGSVEGRQVPRPRGPPHAGDPPGRPPAVTTRCNSCGAPTVARPRRDRRRPSRRRRRHGRVDRRRRAGGGGGGRSPAAPTRTRRHHRSPPVAAHRRELSPDSHPKENRSTWNFERSDAPVSRSHASVWARWCSTTWATPITTTASA